MMASAGSEFEVDPWNVDIDQLSRNLKDGIDLNELSTTGTSIEFLPDIKDQQEEADNTYSKTYQRDVIDHLIPECVNIGFNEDDACNVNPFTKMARVMVDLTGDGGVLKKVVTAGHGPEVPEGAMVRVHYNGYLEYCDEPYDSSRLRNKEQQFILGKGEVLPGWDVAVATMKKGELARLLIKSAYAYGEFGCPPRIPPKATVMYEIEVLGFVDLSGVEAYERCSREERDKKTLDDVLDVANTIREDGNEFFYRGNVARAAAKYRKAANILEKRRLKDEEEEEKWKSLLVKLYLNQSLCSIRMKKPKLAIVQCRSVLALEENNVKAIFRMGQSYMQLSDFERSRTYLVKAGRLSPGNGEIRQELDKLDQSVRKFKAVEKAMYSKLFSSNKSSDQTEGEEEEKTMSAEKVQQYRDLYQEKFSVLASNPNMMQTVVPFPLPKQEVDVINEVARSLNLLTKMVPQCGMKVYKRLPEELQDLVEDED